MLIHCSGHVVKNGWQWILPTSATGTELTSDIYVSVSVCVPVCGELVNGNILYIEV